MQLELDVEKRLQALVVKDRVRIKEFFLDFDKLRKGVVGEAGFRTCLGTLNLSLSKADVDALIEKYRVDSGLINYADFCSNIDSVFESGSNPGAVIEGAKSSSAFDDESKATLISLLEIIRSEITNKRILIKPQFQGYDKTRCSHISSEQFRRVLKELRLIPPTEPLFQLLIRKYFDSGNVREVNYVKFCHDVDHPEDLFPEYVAKHPK